MLSSADTPVMLRMKRNVSTEHSPALRNLPLSRPRLQKSMPLTSLRITRRGLLCRSGYDAKFTALRLLHCRIECPNRADTLTWHRRPYTSTRITGLLT